MSCACLACSAAALAALAVVACAMAAQMPGGNRLIEGVKVLRDVQYAKAGDRALLHAALHKAGVPSTFRVVEGRGHGFGGPGIQQPVMEFFDTHLKKR